MNSQRLSYVLGHSRGGNVRMSGEVKVNRTGRITYESRKMNHARSALHRRRQLCNIGDVTFNELKMRIPDENHPRILGRTSACRGRELDGRD